MSSERAHDIYVPRHKLAELSGEQEGSKEVHRSYARRVVISSLAFIAFAAPGCYGIFRHQQEINRSTEEISVLVKELGYTGAEAYRPAGNEAYITLHAPGCVPSDPELVVENVSVRLQNGPTGLEIASFSHKSGEEKIDGEWRDTVDTWLKPIDLCALKSK